MWQIQPVYKDTYNCFQFLTASIAKYYNCDYRLMMLELWGFAYDNTVEGIIGDKLKLCWNFKTDRRKHLLNYHGLPFDIIIPQESDVEQIIYSNLSQRPIAVYVDSYDCPWVPFYQKLHRPHTLFILDKESDEFIFMDQYSRDSITNKIDIEFVKSNATSVVAFKMEKRDCHSAMSESIIENLNDWEQSGFFQYESFISDMKNNLNIENEIIDDPVASKLIMYLKNLSEDRINFIEAVDLFEEHFSTSLNTVKAYLTDIAVRYDKLRAYIIKCAFSHRGHKVETIESELDQIYSFERLIHEKIQTLVNGNGG